jgi:hypothetical protein
VTFISLDDGQPHPIGVAEIVSKHVGRGIRADAQPSIDEFSVSSMEDPDFLFLLQLEMPGCQIFWLPRRNRPASGVARTETMNLHFFEPASTTLIIFSKADPDGSDQVAVEGDIGVWEKLRDVYLRWVGLERPKPVQYGFVVDQDGRQSVVLTRASQPFEWRLT